MKALKLESQRANLSEAEIIHRVLGGEKGLYELLMRRNNQKLFRVMRGYLRDEIEIEDVMQSTYLKAYEKLNQFKHSASFSTWLIRIGINEALIKTKDRGRVRYIDEVPNQAALNPPLYSQRQKSPEEIVINQETKLSIEKAIDQLDTKHKVVFVMKEIEGMSIREIAECLDLSVSNVKVRLHRAKSTLKDKLFELHLNQRIFEFGFSKCDCLVESVLTRIAQLP